MPLAVLPDDNILNCLLGPGCPFTVEDLVVAHGSGELEIVGSLELLAVLLGTSRRRLGDVRAVRDEIKEQGKRVRDFDRRV